jgi:hypothetical protein
MSEESEFPLSDFVTPIRSGLEPADAQHASAVGRLSDERNARISERMRALEAARQQAEAESRDYHVR